MKSSMSLKKNKQNTQINRISSTSRQCKKDLPDHLIVESLSDDLSSTGHRR